MPPKRPPPLPPDRRAIAGDEQPAREAVHSPGVDGVPVAPRPRVQTWPGIPSLRTPPLPADLSQTAPVSRPDAPTVRVTPPAGLPAQDPERDALRRALEAAEAKVAELQRPAFPPPVSQPPAKAKSDPPDVKLDKAIGHTMRLLFARYAWPALAALGVGGAVLKPTADPAKADATLQNVEAMRAEISLMHDQLTSVLKWQSAQGPYTKCLEESLDEIGEQLLPAQDKLANPTPLRAYVKRCQRLRP